MLLIVLLLLGGVLSTLGDLLGTRIGKARLSIFKLRPRRTAVLITILTGSFISAISLSLMILVSRELRVGLFQLDDIQARLKESRQALVPLKQQREALELKIKKAETELVKLGKDLFAFRKGEVVITSGESLATVMIKLQKDSNVKEEIENILRKANFNAFIKVSPGEKPNRRIVLVRRDHIARLEEIISDKKEWIVNIRSAGNILLGESYVYAFPEVLLNKNIVRKGEVIASINIRNYKISKNSLEKQIKILLASTLAEVKRRGSLVSEIQVDSESIRNLLAQLDSQEKGIIKLEAISQVNSDTAQRVLVVLNATRISNNT
ncbi:Myosin heavy chain [Prochlorococcus marinus str. SS51]|nr:Myosin heavy chain [Prochlorococcus marinus str. SS35]KGG34017.1 Myosin heavy chain [Prochlorococcus marinus str. SS51]